MDIDRHMAKVFVDRGETLQLAQPAIGADPEFFFARKGEVVGAEKILNSKGLIAHYAGKFTIDGVAAEINPLPSTCRAGLGHNFVACFKALNEKLSKDPTLKVQFKSAILLTKDELDSLSDVAKEFGCDPSINIHTKQESTVAVKNPNAFRTRVAGGHLHFGRYRGSSPPPNSWYQAVDKAISTPDRTVPMLDVLLANTCVLIDKGTMGKRRRKLYGRAGDYRIPEHGLEYRPLSSFWLQAYPLMGFVTGMARVAILVVAQALFDKKSTLEHNIMKHVDMGRIEAAINNNDFSLAWDNFKRIEHIIVSMCRDFPTNMPLTIKTIEQFKYFISKPLKEWFCSNAMKHWVHLFDKVDESSQIIKGRYSTYGGRGWETFATAVVDKAMKADKDWDVTILDRM